MTPDEIEELGKAALHPYIADLDEPKLKAFIAGHHSRDPEVERLVEALRRGVNEENRNWEMMCKVNKEFGMRTSPEKLAWVKQAEEALKQYQK